MSDWRDNLVSDAASIAAIVRECKRIAVLGIKTEAQRGQPAFYVPEYMARAVGFHAEDVSQPAEIIPALKRAFDENAKGRPAFVEFICSHHPVHGGWVR